MNPMTSAPALAMRGGEMPFSGACLRFARRVCLMHLLPVGRARVATVGSAGAERINRYYP